MRDGSVIAAFASSEPEAGSDVGSLSTEAKRINGGYVINGQKVFCSNAHISDHVLVVARTTKGEDKHQGLSMIFGCTPAICCRCNIWRWMITASRC